MQIRFWGTRGSLPASLQTADIRKKIKAALVIAAQERFGPGSDTNSSVTLIESIYINRCQVVYLVAVNAECLDLTWSAVFADNKY